MPLRTRTCVHVKIDKHQTHQGNVYFNPWCSWDKMRTEKKIRSTENNPNMFTKCRSGNEVEEERPGAQPDCKRAKNETSHCVGKHCPPNVKSIFHVVFLNTVVWRVLLSCDLQYWSQGGVWKHHFFVFTFEDFKVRALLSNMVSRCVFRKSFLLNVNICVVVQHLTSTSLRAKRSDVRPCIVPLLQKRQRCSENQLDHSI